jgi:TonB family protein
MAHRPMPQPGEAGKVFPATRTSLSVISAEKELPGGKASAAGAPKNNVRKSRFDYWGVTFAVLLAIAVLLLGWRLVRIIVATPPTIQRSIQNHATTDAARNPIIAMGAPKTDQRASISKVPMAADVRASKPEKKTISGRVVVRALVGVDGTVKEARVTRGNSSLAATALQTVRQLTFTPYAPHGTPLEFETEVVVSVPTNQQKSDEGIQISIPQQSQSAHTDTP